MHLDFSGEPVNPGVTVVVPFRVNALFRDLNGVAFVRLTAVDQSGRGRTINLDVPADMSTIVPDGMLDGRPGAKSSRPEPE